MGVAPPKVGLAETGVRNIPVGIEYRAGPSKEICLDTMFQYLARMLLRGGDVLELLKGKPQSFEFKVEANKLYQNGKLSSGLALEEVWERVEKK